MTLVDIWTGFPDEPVISDEDMKTLTVPDDGPVIDRVDISLNKSDGTYYIKGYIDDKRMKAVALTEEELSWVNACLCTPRQLMVRRWREVIDQSPRKDGHVAGLFDF